MVGGCDDVMVGGCEGGGSAVGGDVGGAWWEEEGAGAVYSDLPETEI